MNKLRQLVDEVNGSAQRPKQKAASKRGSKGGSETISTNQVSLHGQVSPDDKPIAAARTPVEDRWRHFARVYIFGNIEAKIQQYSAWRSYKHVYHCTQKAAEAASSRLLRNDKFQVVMASVAKEAWAEHHMDDSIVVNGWLAITQANLMHYFTPAGQVDFEKIHELPIPIQQNLTKIKVVETTNRTDHGETVQVTTEVQVVDRIAVLRDIAKWRGFFAEEEANQLNKVADLIREGQERLRAAARLTLDNETGDPV